MYPWRAGSTPENDTELEIRKEYEAAVNAEAEAQIRKRAAIKAWSDWSTEYEKGNR